MDSRNLVARAVRLALFAGLSGVVSLVPAYAEEEEGEDVAVQEKVTVTGTRIKRAEVEGPLPITIIDREEIVASGEISVAELLRSQTFNTFGSFKQRSGSSDGSQNFVSMRGLGPERTLVLLDGRRMPSSPTGSTSAQSLSMIPLAAVERVEVLRDGASAIYGADALAGVINIILRSDYEGIRLGWEIARPTQSGGDEDIYTLTGGVSGAKGNVTFGFEVNQQEIVFNRDREFTSYGTASLGFPSSYFAGLGADDPRNPTGEFLSVGVFADPRCPETLGSDPDFPWSARDGDICRYAYWGVSATEAENDTKNFFVDANYQINERTQFFARGLFGYNEVWGRYAPAPTWLGMDQDAPQNPTNPANPTNAEGQPFEGQSVEVDTDGDGIADTTIQGPFDLTVFYRNIPGGTRDFGFDDTLLDYVAGLQGTADWLGGTDWQMAAQWGEQTVDAKNAGTSLDTALQSAIDDGSYDVFGVFRPYGADEIAIASAATLTATVESRHRITGADGQLNFDAFQLDNGAVPVVLGFEYRDEDFDVDVDPQTEAGNVLGGSGGGDADMSGARVVKSLFAETLIPVFQPLELNLALRYDDYNDFGTTVNPKASIAYRPLDSLLLRASWGRGFQAPDMWELYSPQSFGLGFGIDSYRCSLTDEDADGDGRSDIDPGELPSGHPCLGSTNTTAVAGNPDLDPETSENWSAGFAWSPTQNLSLIADYYDIKIDDEVNWPADQRQLDNELRLRQAGATGNVVGDVTRRNSGLIETVGIKAENLTHAKTNGVDVEGNLSLAAGGLGDFSGTARWTHVFEFEQDWNDGVGPVDRAGDVFFPQDRVQMIITWSLGDVSATAVGNYIGDQEGTHAEWQDADERLDSFTTWDVQLAYTTPWNSLVTIGARNVFDEDPPQFKDGTDYDIYQHEIYGRVPYLRLEVDF